MVWCGVVRVLTNVNKPGTGLARSASAKPTVRVVYPSSQARKLGTRGMPSQGKDQYQELCDVLRRESSAVEWSIGKPGIGVGGGDICCKIYSV